MSICCQASVADTCNPSSYLGGTDKKDHSSKPAWGYNSWDIILKIQNRAGGVLQVVQHLPSKPQILSSNSRYVNIHLKGHQYQRLFLVFFFCKCLDFSVRQKLISMFHHSGNSHWHLVQVSFSFSLSLILEDELRASGLLGRYSTTWATPSAFFALVIFETGSHFMPKIA
jgi:hypothetical protein